MVFKQTAGKKSHKSLCVCVWMQKRLNTSVFPVFNPYVCSAQTATCQTNTHKTHQLYFSPACFDLHIILLTDVPHSHSFINTLRGAESLMQII